MSDLSYDLAQRRLEPELMDDPAIDAREHAAALRAIERLNRLSGVHRHAWGSLRELAARGPVRALDVASGGGDLTRAVARRAARAGLAIRIDGCDLSEHSLDYARDRARREGLELRYFRFDALAGPLPDEYDWIGSSLFLHHLATADAVRALEHMRAAARRAVFACDLERTRSGLALARAATRLLTRSRVARVDGPLSVAAAFTLDEARELAAAAGLVGARVRRRAPFRWTLEWTR